MLASVPAERLRSAGRSYASTARIMPCATSPAYTKSRVGVPVPQTVTEGRPSSAVARNRHDDGESVLAPVRQRLHVQHALGQRVGRAFVLGKPVPVVLFAKRQAGMFRVSATCAGRHDLRGARPSCPMKHVGAHRQIAAEEVPRGNLVGADPPPRSPQGERPGRCSCRGPSCPETVARPRPAGSDRNPGCAPRTRLRSPERPVVRRHASPRSRCLPSLRRACRPNSPRIEFSRSLKRLFDQCAQDAPDGDMCFLNMLRLIAGNADAKVAASGQVPAACARHSH